MGRRHGAARIESRDKKLVLNEEEAERVRLIFRRYLELASLGTLMEELRERGIVTKMRHLSNGRTIGGIPFTRGSLAYLLRNRFYIGEVRYRGEVCLAQHPAILDRDLSKGCTDAFLPASRVRAAKRTI